MQYNIGDKVEITGVHGHGYNIGQQCFVIATYGDGFYELELIDGDFTQTVHPNDFKAVFQSIGGGVDELRERHGRLPTNSEGHEGGTTFDMNQNSI